MARPRLPVARPQGTKFSPRPYADPPPGEPAAPGSAARPADCTAAAGTQTGAPGLAGLTDEEAARRFDSEGPNELPSARKRGALAISFEVAREPMFVLLVAAGSLYLLMGKPGDALMLLGFVFIVMGITVVQERRTERALDALRDLSSPRALVVRGGKRRRIAGRCVVRGDILLLAEGDRVAADAILRQASGLEADESLLTGESVPVRKAPCTAASPAERAVARPSEGVSEADSGKVSENFPENGLEVASRIYAGTLVTSGQGVAEVFGTGPRTRLGQIGKALRSIEPEATSLQKETARIVRRLAAAGLAMCGAVAIGYGLSRGATWSAWRDGLLAGIAMAMAILPEEFPVVLTGFLALGAWRISRSRVLTRRMPAIEALGAATVLCVDKTGTLTQNRMTLERLVIAADTFAVDGGEPPSEPMQTLLRTAVLASRPDPFDPMERALHAAAERLLPQQAPAREAWSLARVYPLSGALLAVSQAWRCGSREELLVASKGAPEAIADLCRLIPSRRAALAADVRQLAARGLRVLGVARAIVAVGELPAEHRDLEPELLGLVAFADPVRSTVPAAVAECRSAGVRVVMITGDYPETARSIACQAGLANCGSVITGRELDTMSADALVRRAGEIDVFARVAPEQKLRIVEALKTRGEVVAMTGDGVNDAPALKAAHIGIAMGTRGTDVAREAASLVLLDDDFSSIVAAVRLGRRIFDNIRKAITFTLAVHVPIVGLSVVPVFVTGWPLLLLPVHIVFLELIIDPSCSLVFEAEQAEADVMRRPPRDPGERLFSGRTLASALLQGSSLLAVCLAIVFIALPDRGADAARALCFAALVPGFIAMILINRAPARPLVAVVRAPNAVLWYVIAGAIVCLALVLGAAPLRRLFSFAAPEAKEAAASALAGAACVLWYGLLMGGGRCGRRPASAR